MTNKILPVFISFAGCTSRCIYCNQNTITGVASGDIISSAQKQIEENLSYGVRWTEIAFYGGSFTCLPSDIRQHLYELAHKTGINTLRFSTSPDCINDKVLTEAKANSVKTIELGIQSLDDKVLRMNRRPCSAAESESAVTLAKKHIENVGVQIMTGLYGDDSESFAKTIDRVIALKPDYSRIYPCTVLKGTELADMHQNGEYTPQSLADAVAKCAYGFIMLNNSGCDVIRMGLHSSLSDTDSVAAGVYHPAIGDMAKTVVLLIFLESGQEIAVEQERLSSAYGYGGYIKKVHRGKVHIEPGKKINFTDICRNIVRSCGEDYKRKIQEQTDYFAERLICETHDR